MKFFELHVKSYTVQEKMSLKAGKKMLSLDIKSHQR